MFLQMLTTEGVLAKLNAGGFSVHGKCQFPFIFHQTRTLIYYQSVDVYHNNHSIYPLFIQR